MIDSWCDFSVGLTCPACGYKAARLPTYRLCAPPDATGSPASEPLAASDPAPTHGPGTELKKLLAKIGITATPTCSCNARARKMDQEEAREPGWCAANLDEIVGWLREEATKRGLPFVDAAGRLLVRRAISNARKAEARQQAGA